MCLSKKLSFKSQKVSLEIGNRKIRKVFDSPLVMFQLKGIELTSKPIHIKDNNIKYLTKLIL